MKGSASKFVSLFVLLSAVVVFGLWEDIQKRLLPPTGRSSSQRTTQAATTKNEVAKLSPPLRPILFVHFHKSGGTSACRIMKNFTKLALGSTSGGSRNCNVPHFGPRDDPREFRHRQTCEGLHEFAARPRHRRNEFLAVEIPLYNASLPCEGSHFRTFAIMRRPITRVISHMLWHRREKVVSRTIQERTPAPPHLYMAKGYPWINSMVIRQLLGRERFIDTRPIDEQDLALAKQRVDLFDVFVPLEYLQHPKVTALLQHHVPEYLKALRQSNNSVQNANPSTRSYQDELVPLLVEENKYDTLLYDYMLEKLGIEKEVEGSPF